MSTFAFGTQRISDENAMHIEALKEAIEAGVRLIDTAPYYTDGSAQRALKRVMGFFEEKVRSEIEIISKYRYDQDFIESIKESLQNLDLHTIDCYLLDMPEGFYDEKLSSEEATEKMYEKIYDAFVAFEDAVKSKIIVQYGISTENPNLDFQRVLDLAKKAAVEVGNTKESFLTIAFVMNLLEQDMLEVASWAKEHNLRVLVYRPLDAKKDGLYYRLAEYKEPKEYYHALNELLEISDNKELRVLYNLVEQLDANKHKFGWIGEYDIFLYTQILPHIKKAIEKIDAKDAQDVLLEYIDRFLREYRDMVAYESALMTKRLLKDSFTGCNKLMQECALKFLLTQENIDYIVLGMRKPSYLQQAIELKKVM